MPTETIERLCGGTFFMLFLSACKEHLGPTAYYKGKKEPTSEPKVLYSLAKVVVPDWFDISGLNKRTVSDSTRAFKLCKGDGGFVYPFADKSAMDAFNTNITDNYQSLLTQMEETISTYMDIDSRDKPTRLVRELLVLLEADSTIGNEQPFFVLESGHTATKARILEMEDICLHSFLVGLWHYALNRPEGNAIGEATIDLWAPPANHGPRPYRGDLIDRSTRSPNVRLWDGEVADKAYSAESSHVDDSVPDSDGGILEAEIIEERSEDTERDEPKAVNQTVFINNGNGVQIGVNYGPLNFPPHKEP